MPDLPVSPVGDSSELSEGRAVAVPTNATTGPRLGTEAWVNWNPDPKVHAFGKRKNSNSVHSLCRVIVREQRGAFDPDHPKACEECAEFVRSGLTCEQAWELVTERLRAILNAPKTIVCRR